MNFVPVFSARRSRSGSDNRAVVEPHFDFQSEEYRSLHARSNATAFQAPLWLDALYRGVVPALAGDAVPVTVREANSGRLLLVLPLVRRRRFGVTFVEFADFGVCDYLGAVYDPVEADLVTSDATLAGRIAALLSGDVILLTKLARNDLVLERLFPDAHRTRMRVSAHPVHLGEDWETWRAAKFDPGFRHDLDIKRRRVAKRGEPSFVLLGNRDEIRRAFDALREFRTQRFKERAAKDVLENEALSSFYMRVALEGADSGMARTYCHYLSGVPCAVMFGLVHRQTFYLILVGFDVLRYRRLSLGLLTIESTMRASVEAGHSIYDFTIGDYPWKLQFGAVSTPLHEWKTAKTIRGYLALLGIIALQKARRWSRLRSSEPLLGSLDRF
jgi:CelD/BcsL family acetyltransferase involved in cellulose biosynthesis